MSSAEPNDTSSARWVAVAAMLGGLAVVAGAFGAHALKARLSPEALAWWQTAAQYHLIHAVALFAIALAPSTRIVRPRAYRLARGAFLAGITIFAGTLYLMALTDVRGLGAVTPFGGVGLIFGWVAAAVAFWPAKEKAT